MSSRKFIMLVVSLFVFLIGPFVVDAAERIDMGDLGEVEKDKVIRITYNTEVDPASINKENILVHKHGGGYADIPVPTVENGNVVVVKPPKEGYEQGESYTLYVGLTVKSTDGVTGKQRYMKDFSVAPSAEPTPPADEVTSLGTVTASVLNIRSKPTSSSTKLGSYIKGEMVKVYGFDGYWAEIRYNGEKAYLHKTFLKLRKVNGKSAVDGLSIVIDAGHGDHDPGASYGGAIEKEINLDVSLRVEKKLQALGANVLMTRDTDEFLELKERVQFSDSYYADSFISIHSNSFTPSANGAETFYSESKASNVGESRLLAYNIQKQLVGQAGMYDRGVKSADFYVIKHTAVPSVLVELGFVTNTYDREKLLSDYYRNVFAEAITTGIVNYYEEKVK